MTTAVTTEYQNVAITYDENADLWRFELRGRQRSSKTLAKAKESIDAAPPSDEKPFERITAWKSGSYGDEECFTKVTVTSVADTPSWSSHPQVWISRGSARSKESAHELIADIPENITKMTEYAATHKQVKALNAQNRALYESMERIKV